MGDGWRESCEFVSEGAIVLLDQEICSNFLHDDDSGKEGWKRLEK